MSREREWPAHLAEAAGECGRRLGVAAAIHPRDDIFWFIHDDPSRTDKTSSVAAYFEGGAGTAAALADMLAGLPIRRPFSMLEFASGYGRVTRHLGRSLPGSRMVACDIHREAVEFIRSIGGEAVLSSVVPEELAIEQAFDVVFALSFFTHMPKSTWTRWLDALARRVAPGGVLIFTTHGEASLKLMGPHRFDADGFWFGGFSEQSDLDTAVYGNTATSFGYVFRQVAQTGLRLLRFQESGLGHQDLYVLLKADAADTEQRLTAHLSEERRRLLAELAALRNSHSWRLTAPLRAIKRWFHRTRS